jgi:catechol-2,3-dioxygenase
MDQKVFDRAAEDLGNSVGLEHLNLTVPDQQLAIRFYISGLGFTRDPYLVTGLENMWVNIGRNQIHLPIKDAQVLRGHVGLVVPSLEGLTKRLDMVKPHLAKTQFNFERHNGYVEVTCPWGNKFRCHKPDEKRFGRIILGMPYLAFDVPKGAAEKIVRFYQKVIGAPGTVEKKKGAVSGKVTVGHNQHLYFNETDAKIPPYDGHHIQIYIVNFSGPHRQLNDRGLITEESNQYQYRFKTIVDPDTNEPVYEVEHEVRCITHPLFARPFGLVNRNPDQTNRDYRPTHDALAWGMDAESEKIY